MAAQQHSRPEPQDNPARLKVARVAELLSIAGGKPVTARQLKADVARGAPTNPDGTLHLLKYTAWLIEDRAGQVAELAAAAKESPRRVATLAEVAEFFGVAYDTCKAWRRNGLPGSAESGFDLAEVLKWWRAWRERESDDAEKLTPAKLKTQAEIRRIQADAEARERINREAAGGLVDRRAVEASLAALLLELRRAFQAVPAKLQPLLPHAIQHSVSAELKRRIAAALTEAADRLEVFSGATGASAPAAIGTASTPAEPPAAQRKPKPKRGRREKD